MTLSISPRFSDPARPESKLDMSDRQINFPEDFPSNFEIGVLLGDKPYPIEIATHERGGPMNPTFTIEEAETLRDALTLAINTARIG